MGMFDNIFINKKFIPEIPEIQKLGYTIFELQTKDFDNLMDRYDVDENGKLTLEKVEYDVVENIIKPEKDKWCPPFHLEEKNKTITDFPYTGIVDACAYLCDRANNKDEVFVDLKFKFIDGILQSVGLVDNLTITSFETILDNNKKFEELYNKRNNDAIYCLFRYLTKIIYKVIHNLSKLNSWLCSYNPK